MKAVEMSKEILGPSPDYAELVYSEARELAQAVLDAEVYMKLIQARAGHPNAAQGCRNVIDTAAHWLSKYSSESDNAT